jgi:isoleucyl-tRNA synthetase
MSRLNSITKEVTESLEELKPHLATKALQQLFADELSRTYIQYIRSRIQTTTGKNRQAAIYTLYYSLLTTLKLMSPFIPFLTEHLYQNYFRKHEDEESIHLYTWPKSLGIEKSLEENMECVQQVMQTILSAREKAQLGLRWPLPSATIHTKDKKTQEAVHQYEELIKSQMKLKLLIITDKGSGLEFKTGSVSLDTKLTKELEIEGFSREIMRHIQDLRKKAALKREDRIRLSIKSPIDLTSFETEIKEVTGATELVLGDMKLKQQEILKIRNKEFKISFEKV